MRFRCLAAVLIGLLSCSLTSCGNSSKNISSTDTMYVAAQGSAQIWGFRANFFTGALTLINGAPFHTAQPGPTRIVIDPSKNFAYVAEIVPGAGGTQPTSFIQSFSIDANGSFAPGSATPASLSGAVTAMLMDSAGKFLVVSTASFQNAAANQNLPSSISVYSASSGTLSLVGTTQVADSAVLTPPSVAGMALQSTLNLLYVADQPNGYILTYAFDPNSGSLSSPLSLPPVAAGTGPSAIAIHPTGNFLYVANRDSSNVSAFSIALSTQNFPGSLQPITGSPYAAGLGPSSLSVDPSGTFLYVADHDSNQISGYKVNTGTGALAPVANSPFNVGAGPSELVFSPTNRYLYTSNTSAGTVSAMGVDPTTGNLGPNSPVAAGIQPLGIAFGR